MDIKVRMIAKKVFEESRSGASLHKEFWWWDKLVQEVIKLRGLVISHHTIVEMKKIY